MKFMFAQDQEDTSIKIMIKNSFHFLESLDKGRASSCHGFLIDQLTTSTNY